jgi:hypothetical protein
LVLAQECALLEIIHIQTDELGTLNI